MALRMIKSDEEIAHIKQGAQVADIGGFACVAAIAEDVPEHEVALASTGAMVRDCLAFHTRSSWILGPGFSRV